MSKAEDRAFERYPDYKEMDGEYVTQIHKRKVFVEGYPEKDLLGNKHEKSWRLDEKLWKGSKDIEEASYQYTYDASNDWAYDIPAWKDVQDAFKAGSEWKESHELNWKDLALLDKIVKDFMRENDAPMNDEEFFEEVLKRYKIESKK